MAKVKEAKDGHGERYINFQCPGCNEMHSTRGWTFNENFEKPTLSPSVLVRHFMGDEVVRVCHSFVREGRIEFLNDSHHELAGQTVDLPDVE